MFGVSGAVPVFVQGHWWTLLSAGWLHGGLLHIFFNMMWVRQLGPATADVYGSARMIIIYVVAGVAGFALSSFTGAFLPIPFLSGAGYTLGASANIFGLLGALVYYGRRSGSSMIGAQALQYAIVLFVFGLVMRGVDNAAHAGGFIGGYAAGMWLDPLRPERTDHAAGAAISLALTALAILADFDYDRMTVASRALRNGARLVATNDDATLPTAKGLLPGGGAILASVVTSF